MKISSLLMTVAAAGLVASANAQLAKGGAKYLGNITKSEYDANVDHIPSDFGMLWNQITAENKCKWGEIHRARNTYDFSGCDEAYAWAIKNNAHFKFHALVWGSQYPSWITSLDASTLKTVIEEWMAAVANHYKVGNKINAKINGQDVSVTANGLEMIDVVNEAIRTGTNQYHSGYTQTKIIEALGGDENGSYKFVAEAFKMARKYFPNSILIYNDYNTIRWNIDQGIDLIKKIKAQNAPVDAYGQQAHDISGMSEADFKSELTKIHNETQLPIYITEYDVGSDDDTYQLNSYKAHIPFLWETPWIAGITLWGYITGSTWINVDAKKADQCKANGGEWKVCENQNPCNGCSGLITSGKDRAAMTWLREYFKNNLSKGQNTVDFSYLDKNTSSSSAAKPGSSSSQALAPRRPFNNLVPNVPGKIEVENFDEPGEGDANQTYLDKSEGNSACAENSGAVCSKHRENTDVDLKEAASGVAIGWFQTGEWLEYTINVPKAGDYTLYVAASSGTEGGGALKFYLNDKGTLKELTDDIIVESAGEENFDEYAKTKAANVTLPAGEVIIRMECTKEWVDVDYFNFASGKNASDNALIGEDVTPEYTPASSSSGKPSASSSSGKPESIFADRLNLRSNTLEDYDVFDMQGNFMGRLSAYSMGEAFATVRNSNVIKMNGTYFVRNKVTGYSKALRIVK